MAVPGQIQLTVVRMNDRVPLPRASESNRIVQAVAAVVMARV
jgi:hypothetical protein